MWRGAHQRTARQQGKAWPHLCLRVLLILCSGALVVGRAANAVAADINAPLDYQVQAAMLYKFLAYIDWPQESFHPGDSVYRIAVAGDEEVEQELRQITAGRMVNNRPIEVVHVSRISQLGDPHLVFVGTRAQKYLPKLARMARSKSFLIVTENSSGLEPGSAINLRLVDGRIGFDVSLVHAHAANVRLSARLLSVASSVERLDH